MHIKKPKIKIEGLFATGDLLVYIDGQQAKFMGRKSNRLMFTDGRYVVKLDDEAHQSTIEWHWWKQKSVDELDKKNFVCPINGRECKGNGEGYIVQPFIKFKPGRRPQWAKNRIKEIAIKYGFEDFNPNNWNWAMDSKTGQPVIYDFAF